ncbi:MAG: hypothetical protein ACQEUM_07300 [Pseudomonadota bacterium]
MTFLQLTQELARLAGMAGNGGPPQVTGQHGEYRRAVEFVRLAYEEIVNLHEDWLFLWGQESYEVEAGLAVYPPPPELHIWDPQRLMLDSEPLRCLDWQDYTAESRPPSRPEMAVLRPDNSLLLVPTPAAAHTLDFEFYHDATPLTENGDEPMIPERYQRVILGRALMLYGNYENAEDAKVQGQEIYQMYLDRLERHQLPRRQQTYGRQESAPIQVEVE